MSTDRIPKYRCPKCGRLSGGTTCKWLDCVWPPPAELIECMACGRMADCDDMTRIPMGGGEYDFLCPECAGEVPEAAFDA